VLDHHPQETLVIKIVYKVLSLIFGIAGGLLTARLFRQAWKLAAGEDDAPKPDDATRGWREVLAAAAIQGAIASVVRAAVSRSAAVSTRRLTGTWPGKTSDDEA
jgi:Protein of unknown function (DUF4235)